MCYSGAIITITHGRYIVNTPYSRYTGGKEGRPCQRVRTARCSPLWCERTCSPVSMSIVLNTVFVRGRRPLNGCWNGHWSRTQSHPMATTRLSRSRPLGHLLLERPNELAPGTGASFHRPGTFAAQQVMWCQHLP